jgi:hypothetical protein
MNDLQRSVLAITIALVVLLATFILRTTGGQAERVRLVETQLQFDSSFACDTARSLATRFPKRAMGTDNGKAAAEWIASEMRRLGLRTEQQEFSAWIGGTRTEGRNVIGIDEGVRDATLVVVAHYDIPFHVREGAMDDASGIGVLLALARVFSKEEQKKEIIFMASDGEEWGMLGARHFVKEYPSPKRIRAVISLDCVGPENPERISLLGEGQFRGYVPLWLWMLGDDCVLQVGGQPRPHTLLMQYASRAVNISSTDQGPFLRVGIPAINLGFSRSDSEIARTVYHTTLDTSDNLKPELFDVYGRAAELMIRSVDVLDYSIDNNPSYLRTGKRMYVGRAGLLTIQILFFLPLLLATSFQYYNLRTGERFLSEALVEAANIGLFTLPPCVALASLYLLVSTNFIPRYECYPATPLDPFLTAPDWGAISIVAAAFVATWVVVSLVRRALPLWGRPHFASSKAVCLDMLLTLSLVALILNGFAASLFLAPAAILWVWIEQSPKVGHRILNLLFAGATAAPIVLLIYMLSKKLLLGPYVFWYLVLGAGYGFFSPPAVLLAIGAATLGGRLLQKSLMKADTVAEPEAENK